MPCARKKIVIQTFTTKNNISKQIRDVQCVMLFFQNKSCIISHAQ
jgi:hypothetical protein